LARVVEIGARLAKRAFKLCDPRSGRIGDLFGGAKRFGCLPLVVATAFRVLRRLVDACPGRFQASPVRR
jgi:hypothetical protein